MLWNYLKIAYRNFIRQKGYSLINILGLGLGLCCSFLVLMWVMDEFSFDDFHENADSIYRVVIKVDAPDENYDLQWIPTAVGPGLLRDFPEVIDYTRIQPEEHIALDKDNVAIFENAYYVDSSFIKIFTFPLVDGNPDFTFNDLSSIILTSKVAQKFFGSDRDLAGKSIRLSGQYPYTIEAVIKDIPRNSSMKFDVLLPFAIMEKYAGFSSSDWKTRNTYTYVRLQKNTDIDAFNKKLKGYLKSKVNTPGFKDELFLQPLHKVHLFSKYSNEEQLGSIDRLYIVATMAVLILLMACVNYTNMSTAQATRRATEIGIRKVYGARQSSLVFQFLGESIFLSLFAFVMGLCITIYLIPTFNSYTGKELQLFSIGNLSIMMLITLFLGLIAGSYPAFYFSWIAPGKILQTVSRTVTKNTIIRKILIVLQIAFSVMLIICSYIIYSQLNFMYNKDLGYDIENVIRLTHKWEIHGNIHKAFRDKLTESPYIISAAGSV
ncbi:MAG TPA: ABC transporter permease, partial [Chitinispirillaceae bacterium]|nr:ABC transporter permease [Chitinispirillaceae bacterium]